MAVYFCMFTIINFRLNETVPGQSEWASYSELVSLQVVSGLFLFLFSFQILHDHIFYFIIFYYTT